MENIKICGNCHYRNPQKKMRFCDYKLSVTAYANFTELQKRGIINNEKHLMIDIDGSGCAACGMCLKKVSE